VRALRKELGEERANALVHSTLRDWSRQLFLDLRKELAGSPRDKYDRLTAALVPQCPVGVKIEERRHEEEADNVEIPQCRYAEFFKSLNEPECGALLTGEVERAIVEAGAPAVALNRRQPIMKGASYCDFRYKMKRGKV
jgi:hypothetical protein